MEHENLSLQKLNKIRELQSRIIALKQISNDAYNEIVAKTKELNVCTAQINSNNVALAEKKKICADLKFENELLETQLQTWENMLKTKRIELENVKHDLEKEQNASQTARISYCNKAYEFLDKIKSLGTTDGIETSSELGELQNQIAALKIRLAQIDEDISRKQALLDKIRTDNTLEDEKRLHLVLEQRKAHLQNVTYKIQIMKNDIKKTEINNTLENLYAQNRTKYQSETVPMKRETLDYSPSENFKFSSKHQNQGVAGHLNHLPKKLDDIKNKVVQNYHSIANDTYIRPTVNTDSKSKTNYFSCSLKQEPSTNFIRRRATKNNVNVVNPICKKKFIPKQPLLSKKV